jgi:hypothetical protein
MPRRKRSGKASVNVFWPAAIVIAERACNEAIPVAMMSFSVADNNSPHDANGSRPTASGTQTAPKPNSSI